MTFPEFTVRNLEYVFAPYKTIFEKCSKSSIESLLFWYLKFFWLGNSKASKGIMHMSFDQSPWKPHPQQPKYHSTENHGQNKNQNPFISTKKKNPQIILD